MNYNKHAIDALLVELKNQKIQLSGKTDSSVQLGSLGIQVHARDAEFKPAMAGQAMQVTFDAGSLDSDAPGMCVLAVGFGHTPETAAQDAAHQWVSGVLPPLRSWLTKKHVGDVTRSEMVVSVKGSSEQYGWIVHIGPIVWRLFGSTKRESTHAEPNLDPLEMFQHLFQIVHPQAAHSSLFWLECFAARYPDRVDATCRLGNQDWEEGKMALHAMAEKWPAEPDGLLTKRQFIMFEPVPVTALQRERESSGERTDQQGRRPFWKRLFD